MRANVYVLIRRDDDSTEPVDVCRDSGDAFGRERQATIYPDGESWACPFCASAGTPAHALVTPTARPETDAPQEGRPMLTFETQDKIKTWGGWYRHTIVKRDGVEVGRVQERVRPGSRGRRDYLTIRADAFGGGCVLGRDVAWLERAAGEERE